MYYSTNIGIDAHSNKNAVCAIVAQTGETREAVFDGDPARIIEWIAKNGFPEPVGCVYESGPTGFGLARALNGAGIACMVAATSKLSYRVDRQKHDRADAMWLAKQLLGREVSCVRIPTTYEESLTSLSRLRGEIALDLRRAKQRVSSFMLLKGVEYSLTKKRWTKAFLRWAGAYEFPEPVDTFVFREKLAEVLRYEERLARAEARILSLVEGSPELAGRMARLLCIHGIGRVAAFSLVCEVHDFERFRNGRAFASFLGLVPSESSSNKRVCRGPIAKQGNSHLRRILIEAASCYSRPFKAARGEDPLVPEAVRVHAEKCSRRLRKRRLDLAARKVSANKAKVAVARELSEWVYHICVMAA